MQVNMVNSKGFEKSIYREHKPMKTLICVNQFLLNSAWYIK